MFIPSCFVFLASFAGGVARRFQPLASPTLSIGGLAVIFSFYQKKKEFDPQLFVWDKTNFLPVINPTRVILNPNSTGLPHFSMFPSHSENRNPIRNYPHPPPTTVYHAYHLLSRRPKTYCPPQNNGESPLTEIYNINTQSDTTSYWNRSTSPTIKDYLPR